MLFRLESSICQMPLITNSSSPLLSYLQQHNSTRSMLVMGDSRGRRFFNELLSHLTQLGYQCREIRKGKYGLKWQPKYFTTALKYPNNSLTGKSRTCMSCVNTKLSCSLRVGNRKDLTVKLDTGVFVHVDRRHSRHFT